MHPPRILVAAALGLLLSACDALPVDPEIQARRDIGKQAAISGDFKRATDCGSLSDKEEQRGCAAYVNSLDD